MPVSRIQLFRTRKIPAKLVRLSIRSVLGFILIFAGLIKVFSTTSFTEVLQTMKVIPDWSVYVLATLLPCVEIGIGALVILGKRIGILLGLLLNMGFLIVIAANYFSGNQSNECGCFGMTLASKTDLWGIGRQMLTIGAYSFLAVIDRSGRENDQFGPNAIRSR